MARTPRRRRVALAAMPGHYGRHFGRCANPMTRVGLFGGSFNPIHVGHLILAEEMYGQLGLEKVILVPARIPPHKPVKGMVDAAHRLEMIRLAIAGNPHLEASDIELRREGPSYTIDTVRQVLEEHEEPVRVYFLIGEDTVPELPTWKDVRSLRQLCQFVAANRPTAAADPDQTENVPRRNGDTPDIVNIQMPPIGISSTEVRARAAAGRSITYLVPRSVEAYIREKGLYRTLRT